MVPEQQILVGWASTSEKLSPYSCYLPLAQLSETARYDLSQHGYFYKHPCW